MSERETAEAINEQAMQWIARLDREGHDDALQAELEAWLAADTRRQGAYLRAEAAWNMLDRARVLTANDAEAAAEPARLSRRAMLAAGSLAASVVGGLGGWATWREMRAVRIRTGKGEIRRVPLQDGSLAIVNTDTRLKVDLQPDIRAVTVNDGEAWFQVARDEARPFVVKAGEVRVRATGTAFSIRQLPEGALVQVTEGEVEAWCVGREGEALRIAQGGKAFVSREAKPSLTTAAAGEFDRNLAWRSGLIILDGDTLAAAAAEFNRYNDKAILIEDQKIAGQTYVGRFRTNEPEAFVQSVALTLGARVEDTPEAYRIYSE